jgi:hypothetical protein
MASTRATLPGGCWDRRLTTTTVAALASTNGSGLEDRPKNLLATRGLGLVPGPFYMSGGTQAWQHKLRRPSQRRSRVPVAR